MPDKLIVSLFGDSGSGKTTFGRALAALYPPERLCVLHADYFLQDRGARPLVDLRCDFDLITEVLAHPPGTTLRYPHYDFVAWKRLAREGELTFTLREIVVIDFMRPYPAADLFLHLDLPFAEAVQRVVARDPAGWEWRDLLAQRGDEIPSVATGDDVKRLPHRLVLNSQHPADTLARLARQLIDGAWAARSASASPIAALT